MRRTAAAAKAKNTFLILLYYILRISIAYPRESKVKDSRVGLLRQVLFDEVAEASPVLRVLIDVVLDVLRKLFLEYFSAKILDLLLGDSVFNKRVSDGLRPVSLLESDDSFD